MNLAYFIIQSVFKVNRTTGALRKGGGVYWNQHNMFDREKLNVRFHLAT